MRILAIEQSTKNASIALVDAGQVVMEESWREEFRNRQEAFRRLRRTVEAFPDQGPDMIAVGLGPGSFSGMRISLSMANGLALPAGNTVYGVCSAEALAYSHLRSGSDSVAVLGDARRNRLWFASYRLDRGLPSPISEPTLIESDSLAEKVMDGTAVLSPDMTSLGDTLADSLADRTAALVAGESCPTAEQVAALAEARARAGLESAPLTPIYLHPPVFVPPKYD